MRKEKVITLRDRERSLTFKIREMPATQADRWVTRAVLLVGGAANFTSFISGGGLNREASTDEQLGAFFNMLCSGVDYEHAEPMLEELLRCCTRIDAGVEQLCTSESIDGFVEDWLTIKKLEWEALKLMFDFFQGVSLSTSPVQDAQDSVQNKNQGRAPIRMSQG